MPTPRQRWPNGAEFARSESAKLAAETERALREIERGLQHLKADVAPMVPERYRAIIDGAYESAIKLQVAQLTILLHLERAKNGTADGVTD